MSNVQSVADENMQALAATSRWARFTHAPLILQAYIAFAIVASVLGMSVAFAAGLNRAIVPLTGWIGLFLYANTLFFAICAAITSQRKMVYSVVMLLALFVAFGSLGLVKHLVSSNEVRQGFNNPWLTYDPLRPVFTITMPAAWLFLLVSPVMRKWIKTPARENSGLGRYQFSLADLLYATLTVAVCLGLSLALVGIVKRRDQPFLTPAQSAPPAMPTPRRVPRGK